ncbi:MAG: glycine--tRNA ligase [Planctomycetota bacterium]
MTDLVALCKRRGFVYPASEIYGGLNGFWDYGPLGTALKNNLRDHWWHHMVECPPLGPPELTDGEPVTIVGLDSSIIQNPKTWEASGHVGGFNDPMVDDKETKQRFRADHLQGIYFLDNPSKVETTKEIFVDGEESMRFAGQASIPNLTAIGSLPEEGVSVLANDKKLCKSLKIKSIRSVPQYDGVDAPCFLFEFADGVERAAAASAFLALRAHPELVPSPYSGKAGSLTEPRQFNLMLATEIGAVTPVLAYLRPETAQGIFLNYKNVVDTMRVKMPFGIAQIGKSFRNEVTPRNFIFRSREFEQMEMEWFCAPDEALQWYDFWKHERMKWWKTLGIEESNLIFRDHDDDELAHYSNACVDVEYKYPFTAPGYGELEGVAHRGCFDLTQHQEHSKTKMEYFDQPRQLAAKEAGKSKEEINAVSKYIPNVIEPASGLTRAVLVLLCEAFTPDESRPSGVYMRFKPKFAPVKAGVFPLVNKDGMPETAMSLYLRLRENYACEYDAKQSIGKRYARMDEIGTPYCFTVDGETPSDDSVTVRDRDTQSQERVNLGQVETYLAEKLAE